MSDEAVARAIYDKILEIFPEAKPFLDVDEQDLAYLTMKNLTDYLETIPDYYEEPNTVGRVVKFAEWCWEYPRGADASDDVLSIFTVGFVEKLFESPRLVRLVPHLLTREDLIVGRDYWITWVGASSYAQALSLCETKESSS